MKNKIKLIFTLFCLVLCIGCAKKIEGNIVSLRYNINNGMAGSCEYNISTKERIVFTKECVGMYEANFEKEITKEDLDEIKKIINEQEIYKWDGFDRTLKNVLDGGGFTLSVTFDTEEEIMAHGYMKYPYNYQEASQSLVDYFDHIERP